MTEQMEALSLTFHRIEAIPGTGMPTWLRPYFLNADGSIASDLRLGEVGCYASHLAVMLRVIQDGQPALVLEDDIEIEPDFPSALAALDKLPPNWDIIRLFPITTNADFCQFLILSVAIASLNSAAFHQALAPI